MRKYKITMNFNRLDNVNFKLTETIKQIRFGLGLDIGQAKQLIKDKDGGRMDAIVTSEQLGDLLFCYYAETTPYSALTISNIQPFETDNLRDFTS